MMADYKKIAEALRYCSTHVCNKECGYFETCHRELGKGIPSTTSVGFDAADAIEELLARVTDTDVRDIINRLATYEDLEEQGRLVVLPCKPDVTCKHAQGEIYINAIGEACLYCDIWDGQRNISLGECIGNCDCAEAEKAMEGADTDASA